MRKSFWKTFCVDLLLLIILFWLFVFSKSYVAGFLEEVNRVNIKVDEIETELGNESTEEVESFVEEYQYSIWWFYVFMIYLIPLICYLLIFGSQAVNVALLKNNFKRILWNLLLGLAILILFYAFMSYFIENFYFVLSSFSVCLILGLLMILMLVLSYIWLGMVCGDYKKFLRKFYIFGPLYLVMIILFILCFVIVGYIAALYLVGGLLILEFFRYLFFVCVLLVLIQFLRKYIVKKASSN